MIIASTRPSATKVFGFWYTLRSQIVGIGVSALSTGCLKGSLHASSLALLLTVFGLIPSIARAQFSKTITVVPGVQVNAVTTWFVINCTTVGGVGSYSVDITPKHGTLAFGGLSGPIPGCPNGSPSLPAEVAYYTWTDTTSGASVDSFQLTYSFGSASEVDNISVVLNNGIPPIPPPPSPSTPTCPVHVTVTPGAALPPATAPLIIGQGYASEIPAIMNASLTAPDGLDALASQCGFEGFDWVQQITYYPGPSALYAASAPDTPIIIIPPTSPINDPPPGGFTYPQSQYYPYLGAYPFVFNTIALNDCLIQFNGTCYLNITEGNTLNFRDVPTNPCFVSNYEQSYASCEGLPAPSLLQYMAFTTQLVGICPSTIFPDRSSQCNKVGIGYPSNPLFEWTWISDYNGQKGGVAATDNLAVQSADSATGGVTVTSINGVRLPPVVPTSQIVTTASGLIYSRVTQTFDGTVTIKNISNEVIYGPFQIFFMGLPYDVTLLSATGNLSGTPYLTVPAAIAVALAPGQSATLNMQFKNASNVGMNFTPVIYSGVMK
jgi:hypothetical protein